MRSKILFVLPALFAIIGCSNRDKGQSSQSSFSFSEEPSICTQTQSYSNPVSLQSRAQFFARQVSGLGLLGPGAAQDIKYAEVQVLNSGGALVQCGATDGTGRIQLQIPNTPGNYTLKVLSRSDSEFYKVSVLNNPYANQPHEITRGFSVDGTTNSITVAPVIGTHDAVLSGGAFNILDQVYKVNQYLRSHSQCPTQGGVCYAFSVAPPIRVFWTAGISPYSYYGHPTSPISFYTKKDDPAVGLRRGLYIQGGLQGDVDCSDTDHFDNSVIIHEYGHFLEDVYSKSDSPGGSHNGNFVIDPRLAWSEGWSNFFQSAVLADSMYQDTIGNINCSGGTYLGIALDMDVPTMGQDKMPPSTAAGEGIFREISVSRTLYHSLVPTASGKAANVGFPLIWKSFSDLGSGLANSNEHFRSSGRFNQILRGLVASYDSSKLTNLDSVFSAEFQLANQNEYALPVTVKSGSSCSFNIIGAGDLYFMSNWYSHQLLSNDFFRYEYDGKNPVVELHYTGSNPSDLELDVYVEEYVYDNVSSLVARSQHTYPESAGKGFETINLSGKPVGTYMINVRVNSYAIRNAANYYLSTPQGVRLCP